MRSKFALLVLVLASLVPTVSFAKGGKAGDKSEEKPETGEEAPKKSEKELAEEWVVDFMVKNAPPGRKSYIPEAQETKEEALERYKSIAKDLIEVVYTPTMGVPFGGDYGRARTISVMLGIMLFESGFGKHVDYNLGKYARGDNGNSWCLMQMNVGAGRAWSRAGGWNVKHDRPWRFGDKKEDLVKGSSGPEMIEDRRKCFTEGLRLIKISFRSCRSRPLKEKLLVYASGRCDPTIEAAVKGSRIRMTAAIKYMNETKPAWKEFKDDPVKEQLIAAVQERRAEQEAVADKKRKDDKKRKAEQDGEDGAEDKSEKNKDKKTAEASTSGHIEVADARH